LNQLMNRRHSRPSTVTFLGVQHNYRRCQYLRCF
jgi:hypothetical protein